MSIWNFDLDAAPLNIPILVWADERSGYDYHNRCPVWVVCKCVDDGVTDYFVEHDGDASYLGWRNIQPVAWAKVPPLYPR